MLFQMILSVESFAALGAYLILTARMNDHVPGEMLVPLERFAAHRALVRPILVVTLLVTIQVLLALETRAAYVAYVWTLPVILQVLVQRVPILESVGALRTVVDQHTLNYNSFRQ